MESGSNYLLVAAIDFGTTYSGYCFSTRSEFRRDPLSISINHAWNAAGSRRLCSMKTKTCLLLDSDQNFIAFGYDAEDKFADLAIDNKHGDYYYFEHFKMSLHNKPDLNVELILEDIQGKPLQALKVFSSSIKAIKEHLFCMIEKQSAGVKEDEIRWVLTVPAVWTDKAKQFMRKCAEEAGIKKLLIALEPEAASVYYHYQTTHGDTDTSAFGSTNMVVDLGGGTADITVHESEANGNLKEICRAAGGACGGENINSAYLKLWEQILKLESPIKKELVDNNMDEFLDLMRDFEHAKRSLNPENERVTINIPYIPLDAICKLRHRKNLAAMLEHPAYVDNISCRGTKIRCKLNFLREKLFKATLNNICHLIHATLERCSDSNIRHIVLVGGFSECLMVSSYIKSEFPDKKVIVPRDCGLAVLQGAVLFGHRPEIIAYRVMRMTYGICVNEVYDSNRHDLSHLIVDDDGMEMCEDAFGLIMRKNNQVKFGEKVSKTFQTIKNSVTSTIKLYYTEKDDQVYTDEVGCHLLGEVEMQNPLPHDQIHPVNVTLTFGDTEIHLTVNEQTTGNTVEATFKMI